MSIYSITIRGEEMSKYLKSKTGKKFMLVFGTRPEILKFAPIILEMKSRGMKPILVNTNQHYDKSLSSDFFKEFDLPDVNYLLTCDFEFDRVYYELQKIILSVDPDYVFVQGDTDTAFITALVCKDWNYKLIHRESGLRSFDRRMHEEKNRMVIDRLSDIRFVPTENAMANLRNCGMYNNNYLVGNTLVDSIETMLSKTDNRLFEGDYIYFTFHRAENLSNQVACQNVVENLLKLASKKKYYVVFSIHPRTFKVFNECGLITLLNSTGFTLIIDPVKYTDSLSYIRHAELVVTDSGGIQEEAGILGTPCVVLRKTTDRPELVDMKASVLIDPEKEKWKAFKFAKKWKHPYGQDVSKKIVDRMEKL